MELKRFQGNGPLPPLRSAVRSWSMRPSEDYEQWNRWQIWIKLQRIRIGSNRRRDSIRSGRKFVSLGGLLPV